MDKKNCTWKQLVYSLLFKWGWGYKEKCSKYKKNFKKLKFLYPTFSCWKLIFLFCVHMMKSINISIVDVRKKSLVISHVLNTAKKKKKKKKKKIFLKKKNRLIKKKFFLKMTSQKLTTTPTFNSILTRISG